MLSFANVSAAYGPIKALNNISLTIAENEIVTLIGANGAGKSTLLMSIFGQPAISQGEILFCGQALQSLATHQIISLGISIAPERRRIFTKMTTEENLLMGAFTPNARAAIHQNLEKNYTLFPLLKERRKQRAGTLSGGEQQMLSIARALMSEPKLLLLDEPSLGLAPTMVHHLFGMLKTIAQQGTTLFLVEQNAHLALNLADRGYVLVNGEITKTGSAKSLLADPAIQSAYLGHNS